MAKAENRKVSRAGRRKLESRVIVEKFPHRMVMPGGGACPERGDFDEKMLYGGEFAAGWRWGVVS
jgi:hypothetical protein